MNYISIDDAFNQLQEASEKRAEACYNYTRLDEQKKSILAAIELEQHGKSQAEIERKARATQSYKSYCQGLAEAKRDYMRADAHYKNLMAKLEWKKTREVSMRDMIKGNK